MDPISQSRRDIVNDRPILPVRLNAVLCRIPTRSVLTVRRASVSQFMMSTIIATLPACSTLRVGPTARSSDPPYGTSTTWREPDVAPVSFRSMDRLFRTVPVAAPATASVLRPTAAPLSMPYRFRGRTYSIDAFGERTESTGVLVLHGNEIIFERYYEGADQGSRFMSFSVAKSIISTLLGMTLGDGSIASLDDTVQEYLPELVGRGYEGVTLRAVLQMSSGLRFTENYADPESDIYRLAAPMWDPSAGTFNELAIRAPKNALHGQSFDYGSNDTQVLAMIVARVTGKSIADFTTERLWEPIGAASDAFWITDREDVAMAFAGFNCTLRDYGRFGLLMARDGVASGERLLPEGWVNEATTPQSAHVDYGRLSRGSTLGYGYQWWLLPDPTGSFTAQGIYGQFVLVDPDLNLVLVKTSHWDEPWNRRYEAETYALFKAIASHLRSTQGG